MLGNREFVIRILPPGFGLFLPFLGYFGLFWWKEARKREFVSFNIQGGWTENLTNTYMDDCFILVQKTGQPQLRHWLLVHPHCWKALDFQIKNST